MALGGLNRGMGMGHDTTSTARMLSELGSLFTSAVSLKFTSAFVLSLVSPFMVALRLSMNLGLPATASLLCRSRWPSDAA